MLDPRGRSFWLASTIRVMSLAGGAQIAAFHRAEDIDDPVNVVMIDHGQAGCRA